MESLLPDPYGDRVVKEVPLPPQHPIKHEVLFPPNLKIGNAEIPDWAVLKDHLMKEGRLNKSDLV